MDRPLVLCHSADGFVKGYGRLVPIEDGPFQPTVVSFDCDLRKRLQQASAEPEPAVLGLDVEVLEIDAVYADPGGEVEEPQRHTDDHAVHLCDMAERGRRRTEQRVGPQRWRELHLIRC